MKRRCLFCIGLLAFSSVICQARADVKPNALFANNAVLQQGMKVPVWGTADPGERVRVEIAGQSVSATAAANGKWPPTRSGQSGGFPEAAKVG